MRYLCYFLEETVNTGVFMCRFSLILIARVTLVCLVVLTHACNWVDSTGRQGNTEPALELNDGGIFSDVEEESLIIDAADGASDSDGTILSYSWSSVQEEGALQVCTNDIDLTLAASSLGAVCEDLDNCEILFLEDDTNPGLFTVMFPKIRAPIGVTHILSVTDNDGGKTDLSVHFCIDSENDSPVANDDKYTVSEGSELRVDGNEGNGLLDNDTDDEDVRNIDLHVIGVVGKGPEHAASFSLSEDGSFTYILSTFTALNETQDRFSYEVSDGKHTSKATVLIDLSTANDPPVATGSIPPQTAIVGKEFLLSDIPSQFSDPEGSVLFFTATGLPNGISISGEGEISGVATADNPLGTYNVVVTAEDEVHEASLSFDLTVSDGSDLELSTPLLDKTAVVDIAFIYELGTHYSNSNGNPLTFSDNGTLPASLVLSSDGVILGTPSLTEIGSYLIQITVTDNIRTLNHSFTLTVVENQAPVLTESIPDRLTSVGSSFVYDVSSYFTDPENEAIIYTATGLPASGGISISQAGLISGFSAESDRTGFVGIPVTVIATDSSGHVGSGSFTLRIF